MFKSARRIIVGLALLMAVSAMAPAARADDEPEVYDARILGYPQSVQLESGSTALTWLLLIVLGALCVGVAFKDANRSHLD